MAPPKGNRYWRLRKSHGRKLIFLNSKKLWDKCVVYFNWVEDNPLYELKAFHSQGIITKTELPKMRAMTITGLCLFLGISYETWQLYKERNDFIEITTRVEDIIYEQKFTGAAAELLNPNIIARDLGLKDKREFDANVTSQGPLQINIIEDKD